jgi:hypothetical protein
MVLKYHSNRKPMSTKSRERAEERATRSLVWHLRRLYRSRARGTLSERGASNCWEELCIALQTDQSASLELRRDILIQDLTRLAASLPEKVRRALWLSTYAGGTWLERSPVGEPPVNAREIAKHVEQEVLDEAMNYQNARIRRAVHG